LRQKPKAVRLTARPAALIEAGCAIVGMSGVLTLRALPSA
jgi:hypothetical protein